MIKGKAAKEYKWVLGICYLLFYAVIAWTALDKISYIFILPLLSILILYKDPKFIKMIMWFTLFVLISSNIYKGVAKGMMDLLQVRSVHFSLRLYYVVLLVLIWR